MTNYGIWLNSNLSAPLNLPASEVLAQDNIEQLEVALEQFRIVEEVLEVNGDSE